jgi:hypothetical protein
MEGTSRALKTHFVVLRRIAVIMVYCAILKSVRIALVYGLKCILFFIVIEVFVVIEVEIFVIV